MADKKSVKVTTKTEGDKIMTITETTITKPNGQVMVSTETVIENKSCPLRQGGTPGSSKAMQAHQAQMDVGETSPTEYQQAALSHHNKLRAKHGSPSLSLAKDLIDYAKNYAEKLVKLDKMQHSDATLKGSKIGENLALMMVSGNSGDPMSGQGVTQMWYDEIKDYSFKSEGKFSNSTGHFTQVVWKDSKEMGIAKATNGKGKWVSVANYRPPGNVQGKFNENVLPPK